MGLRHTGRDGADADFRHQLDGHRRIGIGVFQIEDELREVFDGIDVVVRRRRNQLHARRGITKPRDVLIDLVSR